MTSSIDSRRLACIAVDGKRAAADDEVCRLGVPLPIGLVRDCRTLRLIGSSGKPLALQTKPLVAWPDGSAKWVLLDWLGGGREVQLVLVPPLSDGTPESVDGAVSVAQQGGSVTIFAGDREIRFRPGDRLSIPGTIEVETGGDKLLDPIIDEIAIIDSGPLRACVRLFGSFRGATGATCLRWIAEGHIFAARHLQRWSLTLRNTRAASHPGGIWELGDSGSVLLRSATIRIKPRRGCDCSVVSLEPYANLRSGRSVEVDQVSSGGDRWRSLNHIDREGRVPFDLNGCQFAVDGQTSHSDRSDPIVTLSHGSQPVLGIYVEDFWQKFPQRLRATTDEIAFDVFPARPGYQHELQGGEQTTRIFWIGEGDSAAIESLERVRTRLQPKSDSVALAESQVIPFFTPVSDEEHPDYRAIVQQAVDGSHSFFVKRELVDEYGWRHFGDAYGDHEAAFSPPDPPLISHWNNQYDLVFGLGVRYLRGGDDRWFELMEDMAWHVADIDMYHTDGDKLAYNHGLFWHTVHYRDAGRATHRTYPKGCSGGGPCAEHAYARGLLLYYCLTGESSIRDAVVEMGEWILNVEDGSRTPFRFLSSTKTGLSSASGSPSYHGPGRGPGNATETLLTAFELTGRREFLERVDELMYRVVHPQDDLQQLNLLDAERRWFYTLYLQALGRYLEVKIERSELDAAYDYGRETLLHYARWMAKHEYPYLENPEILEFPTETWVAQDVRKSEVFGFASRHASGEERPIFIDKAEWFYQYSATTLTAMKTRHFCRPIALMLGSGFSRDGLRRTTAVAPQPVVRRTAWPRKHKFVPQKQRASRRAKSLLAGSAALALCGIGAGVAWLIFC